MTAGGALARLRAGLSSGKPQMLAWSSIADPGVPELMTRGGFDAALLDMQHGGWDYAACLAGIASVGYAGKACLVRVPVGEFALASRLLDAGAAAVVAPMINSAQDARDFVSYAKFPPLGERSWGPVRALGASGLAPDAYLAAANDLQLAIAMIETRAALDALDSILDVPGVDGVLVGPSDLSIALSDGAKIDPDGAAVDAALDRIAAACKARGKVASAFCMSGARAGALGKRGFHLLSIGNDQILLRQAMTAELAIARG